ncbi:hypothetical protein [Geodermatophilus sp. URMC 63]
MSAALGEADRAWCDDLLLALRLREVPGARIGEVLAEVHSHVAETGEAPAEAFGPAEDYADRIADALGLSRVRTWTLLFRGLGRGELLVAVLGAAAFFLLGDGLWSLGAGSAGVLGLPGGVQTAVAVVLVAAVAALCVRASRRDDGTDAVIDPRTGADMVSSGAWRVVLLVAPAVLVPVGMYLGGVLVGG